MNYTISEANKIRVGDTLTLEDGSVHEAVKDSGTMWNTCSMSGHDCSTIKCYPRHFHFIKIKP